LWLNAPRRHSESFAQQVTAVCQCYAAAAANYQQGVHTVCVDEKTGMQAVERIAPTRPLEPGRAERREYEYARHGTQCLTANLEVGTGRILAPTLGSTRTAKDFLQHVRQTIASDPHASWIFVCDNLNTHSSEELVRWVADECGIEHDLGRKAYRGVLQTQHSRARFLADPAHRIRFVYLPKHCSWLNQIESWFSILARRLLKRGSFNSLDQLTDKIREFVVYFNRTLAKPFKWRFTGWPAPAQSPPISVAMH
jgi:transposase